jgi:anti-anti-sigma regulatory factor
MSDLRLFDMDVIDDDVPVVKLRGEFDLTGCALFLDAFDEAIDSAPGRVEIDLSDVRLVSPRAFGATLAAVCTAASRGILCSLRPCPSFWRLLALAGDAASWPEADRPSRPRDGARTLELPPAGVGEPGRSRPDTAAQAVFSLEPPGILRLTMEPVLEGRQR